MIRDIVNDTQFKFRATTRSAVTASAVLRTLGDEGNLLVAQDHLLAVLMPDALDNTTYAPDIAIPINGCLALALNSTVLP